MFVLKILLISLLQVHGQKPFMPEPGLLVTQRIRMPGLAAHASLWWARYLVTPLEQRELWWEQNGVWTKISSAQELRGRFVVDNPETALQVVRLITAVPLGAMLPPVLAYEIVKASRSGSVWVSAVVEDTGPPSRWPDGSAGVVQDASPFARYAVARAKPSRGGFEVTRFVAQRTANHSWRIAELTEWIGHHAEYKVLAVAPVNTPLPRGLLLREPID